jgi:hypothetical protein
MECLFFKFSFCRVSDFFWHIVFYGNLGWGALGTATDLLQCFPANCLYGDKNELHVAV